MEMASPALFARLRDEFSNCVNNRPVPDLNHSIGLWVVGRDSVNPDTIQPKQRFGHIFIFRTTVLNQFSLAPVSAEHILIKELSHLLGAIRGQSATLYLARYVFTCDY